MSRLTSRSPVLMLLAGLTIGLLVGVGMLIGGVAAVSVMTAGGDSQNEILVPHSLLNATSVHGADTFAMATGPIDGEAEGLFVLDFLTGDLQCWVLNYRSGLSTANKFSGAFKYNVLRDLGVERGKTPKFVMVTGGVNFRDAASFGATRPAASVVYVADANSGNVAVYGVPWAASKATAGAAQGGALALIATGKGRAIPVAGGGNN